MHYNISPLSECGKFNSAERICDHRDALHARHREQLLKDVCKSRDLVSPHASKIEHQVVDNKTFSQSDCRSQDDERKAGTELKRRKERKDKEIDEGTTAASSRPGKGGRPKIHILFIGLLFTFN